MQKTLRAILIVILALAVISSTFIVAYAETTVTTDDDGGTVITIKDDGGRAYQLVWKYKSQDGHLWRRRWNMTLGEWYDPAWILVY